MSSGIRVSYGNKVREGGSRQFRKPGMEWGFVYLVICLIKIYGCLEKYNLILVGDCI